MSIDDHPTVKGETAYDPRQPGCPRSGSLGALLRVGMRLSHAIEAILRGQGFPPLRWLDVLVELYAAENRRLTQTQIEGLTAITQHNLSRQLDRMQADGLLERRRCPFDKRAHHVVLTPKGEALRIAMGKAFTTAVAAEVGSRLSLDDAQRLKGLVGMLAGGNDRAGV